MSRYIDADELLTHVKDLRINTAEGYEFRHRCIDPQYVYDAPTADVVTVVRCKDCKYAHMTYDGECKYCDKMKERADGESISLYLPGDWFCADGERRE